MLNIIIIQNYWKSLIWFHHLRITVQHWHLLNYISGMMEVLWDQRRLRGLFTVHLQQWLIHFQGCIWFHYLTLPQFGFSSHCDEYFDYFLFHAIIWNINNVCKHLYMWLVACSTHFWGVTLYLRCHKVQVCSIFVVSANCFLKHWHLSPPIFHESYRVSVTLVVILVLIISTGLWYYCIVLIYKAFRTIF